MRLSSNRPKRVLELVTRAALAVYHQKRVMPNWMIAGSDWEILLANVSTWQSNTNGEMSFSSFLNPVGTLPVGGGITNYSASLPWPVDQAVIGYKGQDFIDNNAFFLPYIP